MRFNRPQYRGYNRPSFFGGFSFFPPVIKGLLISNIAVFVGTLFLGNFRIGDYPLYVFLHEAFALMPLGEGFGVWQLFTYMFMHGGFSHIFFNMLALWMFGLELENAWGSRKFLIYYLVCGIGAGLSNLLLAPLFTAVGPTIGASGAVYGVLVAYGLLFPDRLIFIYFFVPIKAKYFVLLYMAIEIISIGSVDGVAHFAHLGGAIVGLVYVLAEGYQLPFLTNLKRQAQVFNKPTTYDVSHDSTYSDVSDAKVYDLRDGSPVDQRAALQKQIDEILDKISKGGYQSLSDEEKRILFEASKKLN